MGIWKLPWESMATAKLFAKNMQKPWIAKVSKDPEDGFLNFQIKDIGKVYGADDLYDYLGEVTDKKKKDFDIRKMVVECLQYQTWWFEHNYFANPKIQKELSIKAFNLVRECIGEKAFDPKLPPLGYNQFLTIQNTLLEQGCQIERQEFLGLNKKKSWNLITKMPSSSKANLCYGSFQTKGKFFPLAIVKKLPFLVYIKKDSLDKNCYHMTFIGSKVQGSTSKAMAKVDKSTTQLKTAMKAIPSKVKLKKVDKKSNKFWHGKLVGNKVITEFGRVGATPRISEKLYTSKEEAKAQFQKLVNEKFKKGYAQA